MGTPLDSKRNHRIDLATAAAMTRNYRTSAQPPKFAAGAFLADQVSELLNQAGCVGLRAYGALDAEGNPTTVLVGVDDKGDDMVNGVLLEYQLPCPPWCASANALNS